MSAQTSTATPSTWGQWFAANNGSGARIWFVLREDDRGKTEYHESKDGTVIRYTMAGADRKAAALNAA